MYAIGCNLRLLAALALLAGTTGSAFASGTWRVPEQPLRAVFHVPREAPTHVLVRVPAMNGDAAPSAFRVVDAEGTSIPFRVVGMEENAALLLVGVGTDPGKEYSIYFGKDLPGDAPTGELVDPLPIRVSFYTSRAKGIPNTWAKMQHMVGLAEKPSSTFRQHAFGALSPPSEDAETGESEEKAVREARRRREASRDSSIVKMSTYVHCPVSGPYRWAIDCTDAGFVFVGGELVASRLGQHPGTGWEVGPAVFLEQGVHAVEVFQKSEGKSIVRLGWQPPEASAVTNLPHAATLASAMAETVRIDRQDDPVHPGFEYAIRRAYVFRGRPEVFVPVHFRSTSVVSKKTDVSTRWEFGDGTHKADVLTTEHVFKRLSAFKVTLVLTDQQGREYRCERTVDCRLLLPRPLACTAQLIGLSAVCFADDKLEPMITVSSPDAPSMALDIAWTVLRTDGETVAGTQQVATARQALEIPLGPLTAGDLDELAWDVSHVGVTLESEVVSFLRPPFPWSIDEVRGDALHARSGRRAVLVPHQVGEFRQRPLTLQQAYGRVLCLDDTLATSSPHRDAQSSVYFRTLSRIVDGPDRPIVDYVALESWYGAPLSHGALMKLVDSEAALAGGGFDLAVLSLGMQDIARKTSVADFERQMAALVDIVSSTRGVSAVLATPPPFGADPAIVRPYAAAILRVGQARGVPVADLFSAFMSTGAERGELFAENNDYVLSSRGHQLAARVIARAMLSQGGHAR